MALPTPSAPWLPGPLTDAVGLDVPFPTGGDVDGFYLDGEELADRDSAVVVDTTFRVDGEAEAVTLVGVGTLFGFALEASFIQRGVWDVILIDSLPGQPCAAFAAERVGAPIGGPGIWMFLGGAGNLELHAYTPLEGGEILHGIVRPNVVAPAGAGGECVFHNLYVAVTAHTFGVITVTPIVDGRVLTAEARDCIVGSSGERIRERFEIPFSDPTRDGSAEERARRGVRGRWVSCLIDFRDIFACGPLVIDGVEVEYTQVSESLPTLGFTAENLQMEDRPRPARPFFGAVDLLEAETGLEDDGEPIQFRVQANPIAPSGIGGEAVFHDVYLTITRSNPTEVVLLVTPVVDGLDLPEVELPLPGVEDPVTEAHEIGLALPILDSLGMQRGTRAVRGVWMSVRIELDAPAEWTAGRLIIEGVEVSATTATESEEPAPRAT